MYLKLLVIDLHFLTHKHPTPPPISSRHYLLPSHIFTPCVAANFFGEPMPFGLTKVLLLSGGMPFGEGGGGGGLRLLPRLHKLLTWPRVEGQEMNLLCHTNRRMNKQSLC